MIGEIPLLVLTVPLTNFHNAGAGGLESWMEHCIYWRLALLATLHFLVQERAMIPNGWMSKGGTLYF